MDEQIIELSLIAAYLKKKGQHKWANLIQGFVIHAEANIDSGDDSDYEYEEGDAVQEEKPIVIKCKDGHRRLY
jgi:hypothetical protein